MGFKLVTDVYIVDADGEQVAWINDTRVLLIDCGQLPKDDALEFARLLPELIKHMKQPEPVAEAQAGGGDEDYVSPQFDVAETVTLPVVNAGKLEPSPIDTDDQPVDQVDQVDQVEPGFWRAIAVASPFYRICFMDKTPVAEVRLLETASAIVRSHNAAIRAALAKTGGAK